LVELQRHLEVPFNTLAHSEFKHEVRIAIASFLSEKSRT
jgi:hypothetical protein